MRKARARLEDAYKVHKLENEYRHEVGLPLLTNEEYIRWTKLLFDDKRIYLLFSHGKAPVGLLWGHEDEDGVVVVEGRYLKPTFRKFRFKREFTKAWVEFRQSQAKLQMRLPPNCKSRHKALWQTVAIEKKG